MALSGISVYERVNVIKANNAVPVNKVAGCTARGSPTKKGIKNINRTME